MLTNITCTLQKMKMTKFCFLHNSECDVNSSDTKRLTLWIGMCYKGISKVKMLIKM